mgnify:CR=1 FL=1
MKKILTTVLFAVSMLGMLSAQQSQEELSEAAANPLADLMSFPFQNNLNMNYGEYNRNVNILNIQKKVRIEMTRSFFCNMFQK